MYIRETLVHGHDETYKKLVIRVLFVENKYLEINQQKKVN